jgi:hypothetical protein
MNPDELPRPPRKRRWKRLMVALACVVAVTTIALLSLTPKKEPVKVRFVGSTNSVGRKYLLLKGTKGVPRSSESFVGPKHLVFQGTNGLARQVNLCAGLVRGVILEDNALTGLPTFFDTTGVSAPTGTNFYFALKAPSDDVPYVVMWYFYDFPPRATRWERFRMGCQDFFVAHGMPALARRLVPPAETHFIPSTEIKE